MAAGDHQHGQRAAGADVRGGVQHPGGVLLQLRDARYGAVLVLAGAVLAANLTLIIDSH